MELLTNKLAEFGIFGIALAGLTLAVRYLFAFIMKQLQDKESENKAIEIEFRSYLIANVKQNSILIEHFTDTIEKMTDSYTANTIIIEKFITVVSNLEMYRKFEESTKCR